MDKLPIPSFPSRKESWKIRRNLTANKPPVTNSESSLTEEKYENDPDIHPDHGLLKVQPTYDGFMSKLKGCIPCGHENNIVNVDVDSDHYVLWCGKCNVIFGLDDTKSVYETKDILDSWKAELCPCGNSDLQKYTLEEESESDKIYLLCEECMNKIPIDIENNQKNEISKEDICIECHHCLNKEKDLFSLFLEENEVTGYECLACENVFLFESEDDYNLAGSESNELNNPDYDQISSSRPRGRHEIHNAWGLHEVDHIAWWRPEGYWHHALVESIHPETNEVNVMHYNGPSPGGHGKVKGKIVEEKLNLSNEKGLLYRLTYSGDCFDLNTTIANARHRLGEASYNLITNNCEHFVRWCKTGYRCSEQVCSVVDTAKHIGSKVTSRVAIKLIKRGILTFMAKSLGSSSTETITATVSGGIGDIVATKAICNWIGVGAVIAIEMVSAINDIHKQYKLKCQGHISNQEFLYVVVRRGSQAVGGSTGAVAGGYCGQVLIPIPIVGGFIGCTLGSVIGHAVGHIAGYKYVAHDREKRNKYHQFQS